MSDDEKLLLVALECCSSSDSQAIVLQSFIADNGPLSEDVAEKVRTILKEMQP